MNAPDMSACVGPVLFRHDPPQCGEVGGFGARSDETAIEPANHRENRSEFGLAHIQKGAVLGDALDCARRMVGPDLHTTAPAAAADQDAAGFEHLHCLTQYLAAYADPLRQVCLDRKSTRLNSSH